MASKIYTAQEMRDVAQCLHYNSPTKLTVEASAMLRQAADAMERNESLQSKAGETVVGLMNKMNAQAAEIARLRAALKPVLECPDRWHGHWPFAAYASDAVKEAQSIYKESEVK